MEHSEPIQGVSKGYVVVRALTRPEKDRIAKYLNDKARKRLKGPLSTEQQLKAETHTCKAVLGHFSDRPGQVCGATATKTSDFCRIHLKQKQRRARYP